MPRTPGNDRLLRRFIIFGGALMVIVAILFIGEVVSNPPEMREQHEISNGTMR
jgi:hypothetical protein